MARPLLLLLPALLLLLTAAQLPHLAQGRSTTSSGGLTLIRTVSNSNSNSSSSSANPAPSSSLSPRKRHRKRNSNWIDYRNFDENTTALEWANPCGGNYHPAAAERFNRQRPRQSFNQLKRHAFREYRSLNSSQDSAIDIRNMTMWSLHTHNYKFLPKLKPNSTIALKRWYRNMQTYVASFAYLRRQQIRWDQRSITRESSTARELRELLLSSRRILCELETAVNQTQSPRQKQRRSGAAAVVATQQQHQQLQLPQISRLEMNKRLKLRTKTAGSDGSGSQGGSASSSMPTASSSGEADSIDMRFVKHHYYDFLRTMYQLLRRDGKRVKSRRPRKHHKKPKSQKKNHQKKQQQQHQLVVEQLEQQQRWRSSASQNGKEFNEVSKPAAASAAGGPVAGGPAGRRGKRQSRRVQRT
ncbi:hypothetical protein KR084_006098 [Drosophila pseudotakahashii]|nr:hypothetical protein KR084_006098 [Drosophila pseudotakahashii]